MWNENHKAREKMEKKTISTIFSWVIYMHLEGFWINLVTNPNNGQQIDIIFFFLMEDLHQSICLWFSFYSLVQILMNLIHILHFYSKFELIFAVTGPLQSADRNNSTRNGNFEWI